MRIFLTSPWIPAEWVRAHGLDSQGIWSSQGLRRAALPLSAGTCLFAEQVVQFAESQIDAAVVFSTACDQLRRGFDAAAFRSASRSFLFNLPATQTPAAKQIYRAELERLGRFLVELGGVSPTPEILRREMSLTNEARQRLRPAATSSDAHSFAEAVARFHRDGRFSGTAYRAAPDVRETRIGLQTCGFSRISGNRISDLPLVRLAIIGGPLSMADWTLFDAIEAAGGLVALNAADTGERMLCPAFESNRDPFAELVDGYFESITDVFSRPNLRLYSWLKPRLLSRQVRGLVLWCFTGCDLWRAEMQTLREICHLPVLLLEAGDAAGISRRDINRLQAFVETLK